MTFIELPFAILLAVTAALWLLCRRHYGARIAVLLIASFVFYGHNQWPLAGLLAAFCAVDWAIGRRIARSKRPGIPLAIGIACNLGVLVYWKYTPMLVDTLVGVDPLVRADSWIVPAGLSFYALTGIAYLVDVYRRATPAEPNLARFAVYLSFFPHLLAGPILRAREFLPSLQPGATPDRPLALTEAALLLGRGYFKKMVLADRIAVAIDPFFLHVGTPATAGVWSLPFLYLYAFQIYFDFSGYTDIARGLALFFGFRWPDNFNLPYAAASVREFWRRWHMTLSRFLRDYVYIPLGGSRASRWRTPVNLMATMLIGGLWHGGSWSFVVWGGVHGAYLLVHRAWSRSDLAHSLGRLSGLPGLLWRLVCVVLTFHAVCLAWSFFRVPTLAGSLVCLRQCASVRGPLFAGGSADVSVWLLIGIYGAFALAARALTRSTLGPADDASLSAAPALPLGAAAPPFVRGVAWGTAVALFALAVLLAPGGEPAPFIYFQF